MHDRTAASFLRGLTIGALIGAAIVGSGIWTRLAARRRGRSGPDQDPPAEA